MNMAQHKILIIDDDHDVLLTARMFLEQLEYEVTVLSDPEKSLTQIKKEHFDVILLDMVMPRMDGLETMRQIKKIRPEQKVIIVSGYTRQDLCQTDNGCQWVVYFVGHAG